jgi:hypothetical protein
MQLTSGAHANKCSTVFDNNVHKRLGCVHVQSFKYIPQEVVSCNSGHVPFQDAQQEQLPHL